MGGNNYGQGSSREHAALVPAYLGVRCVIAKSFARIHKANLINAGILPLTFENPEDYDLIQQGDCLRIGNLFAGLNSGDFQVVLTDSNKIVHCKCETTERQRSILLAGGLLKYTGEGGK